MKQRKMSALSKERKHHSKNAEIPAFAALPRGRTAEERYGNFIVQQGTTEHQELVRLFAFNSCNALSEDDIDQKETYNLLIKLALLALPS